MKIRSSFYGVLILVASLVGCATMPELSSMQRRQMQSRSFDDANYDSVFRAFKTILQDDGYVIKNQDLQGGLIVATIEKSTPGSVFMASMNEQKNYQTSEGYEVSINLEKMGEKTVESRLTIQKLEAFSQGGHSGREILDAELYQTFYDKVRVEVERRKAQGKG